MLHVSGSFVNAAVVYLLIGSLHMLPFNITYENFFFFFYTFVVLVFKFILE